MDEDMIEAAIAAVYGREAHLRVRRPTQSIPSSVAEVIDGKESLLRAVGASEDAAKLKLSRAILADADNDCAELEALRVAVRGRQAELEEEDLEGDEDADDLWDHHDEDEADDGWDDEDDEDF